MLRRKAHREAVLIQIIHLCRSMVRAVGDCIEIIPAVCEAFRGKLPEFFGWRLDSAAFSLLLQPHPAGTGAAAKALQIFSGFFFAFPGKLLTFAAASAGSGPVTGVAAKKS